MSRVPETHFRLDLSHHSVETTEFHVNANRRILTRVLGPSDITEEDIYRTVGLFKYTYDNGNNPSDDDKSNTWNEFAVCPPCEIETGTEQRFSAIEAIKMLGLEPGNYLDQNGMVPVEITATDCLLPDCPRCKKRMQLFHDFEILRKKTRKKLWSRGYLSQLILQPIEPKDRQNEVELIGESIGYPATLEEALALEWTPYGYVPKRPEITMPPLKTVLNILREKFPKKVIKADTQVGINGSVAVLPKFRRGGNGTLLQYNIFGALPEEYHDMLYLAEVIPNTPGQYLCKAAGGIEIPGLLGNNRTVMAAEISEIRALAQRLNLT